MELKPYLNLKEHPDYEEYLDAVIAKIGLEKLKPCLPVELAKVREALKTDRNLNNIPLDLWDHACGFYTTGSGRCIPIHSLFRSLIEQNFHQSISCAGSVAILKHAAIWLADCDETGLHKESPTISF